MLRGRAKPLAGWNKMSVAESEGWGEHPWVLLSLVSCHHVIHGGHPSALSWKHFPAMWRGLSQAAKDHTTQQDGVPVVPRHRALCWVPLLLLPCPGGKDGATACKAPLNSPKQPFCIFLGDSRALKLKCKAQHHCFSPASPVLPAAMPGRGSADSHRPGPGDAFSFF